MPKFVLVYHGGSQPEARDTGVEQKERFMEWMERVGDALVSPANPFGPSKLVSAEGVTDTPPAEALTGYSILEVADLDEAVEIAKDCPFLHVGTLEVARLVEMPSSG